MDRFQYAINQAKAHLNYLDEHMNNCNNCSCRCDKKINGRSYEDEIGRLQSNLAEIRKKMGIKGATQEATMERLSLVLGFYDGRGETITALRNGMRKLIKDS